MLVLKRDHRSSFGFCHQESQKLFLEGISICITFMKIFKAIENFNAMIKKLKVEMGKFFIE